MQLHRVFTGSECLNTYEFLNSAVLIMFKDVLTCDQAFFFRRSAKEKQRETRLSVGGQSGFSQARKAFLFLAFPNRHSRVAIVSRSSEKITPDRRLRTFSSTAIAHPYCTR